MPTIIHGSGISNELQIDTLYTGKISTGSIPLSSGTANYNIIIIETMPLTNDYTYRYCGNLYLPHSYQTTSSQVVCGFDTNLSVKYGGIQFINSSTINIINTLTFNIYAVYGVR